MSWTNVLIVPFNRYWKREGERRMTTKQEREGGASRCFSCVALATACEIERIKTVGSTECDVEELNTQPWQRRRVLKNLITPLASNIEICHSGGVEEFVIITTAGLRFSSCLGQR